MIERIKKKVQFIGIRTHFVDNNNQKSLHKFIMSMCGSCHEHFTEKIRSGYDQVLQGE